MKLLIKEHENHIKGYGFTSDLLGSTIYGIDKEIIYLLRDQGAIFTEEFEEDFNKPKYEFRSPDCPPCDIPVGRLKIYAEFK
jgi:hypothetical protein